MAEHELAVILECPLCGGKLAQQDFRCKPEGCGTAFRFVLGIPDLRLAQQAASPTSKTVGSRAPAPRPILGHPFRISSRFFGKAG